MTLAPDVDEAFFRAFAGAVDLTPKPRRWATPGAMAFELDATTVQTPALDLIDSALVDIADGRNDRLILTCPPQEGKSERASRRFPLWLLANNPDLRVAIVSYSDEMARRWGSDIKRDLEDNPDLGLELRADSKAAGRWQIEGQKGGVYCVGIAGSLTGKPVDCVRGDTKILTEYGYVRIDDIHRNGAPYPRVLGYDHPAGRAEWRDVVASRAVADRPLVEVVTEAGRRIVCTPDHRIHTVDQGYVPAHQLRAGQGLVVADPRSSEVQQLRDGVHEGSVGVVARHPRDSALLLKEMPVRGSVGHPDMRRVRYAVQENPIRSRKGKAERIYPHLLHEAVLPGCGVDHGCGGATMRDVRSAPADRAAKESLLLHGLRSRTADGNCRLRSMCHRVRDAALRIGEEATQGLPRVLLQGVRGGRLEESGTSVPSLWYANRIEGPAPSVLLKSLPPRGESRRERDSLPPVRSGVLSKVVSDGLLRSNLRERRALEENGRGRQLALQGRDELRGLVPQDAPAHLRAGRTDLPGLRDSGPNGADRARRQFPAEVVTAGASHQRATVGQPAGEPDSALRLVSHHAPQVEADTVSVVRELRGTRDVVYDLQVDGTSNFFAGEILVHNCLIVDDPIKDLEQARSAIYRERAWRFWQAVAVPRLGPGAKAVLIQTRWHEDDLAGRLIEHDGIKDKGGRWRLVSIPAEAEEDDDVLGRRRGEFMVSARGDRDWPSIKKSVGAYVWSSLYQQHPSPAEGGLFKRLWWRYHSIVGNRIHLGGREYDLRDCWRFATVDLAASTRTSADYTVIAAWARTISGDLVLLDLVRAKIGEEQHFTQARPLVQRWQLDTVFVEASQYGTTLVREATHDNVPITPIQAEQDKFSRALPYSAWVSSGRVWLPGNRPHWLDAFVSEHASFPAAAHDDTVDVGSMAIRVAVTKAAPTPPGPIASTGRSVQPEDAAFGTPLGDFASMNL